MKKIANKKIQGNMKKIEGNNEWKLRGKVPERKI